MQCFAMPNWWMWTMMLAAAMNPDEDDAMDQMIAASELQQERAAYMRDHDEAPGPGATPDAGRAAELRAEVKSLLIDTVGDLGRLQRMAAQIEETVRGLPGGTSWARPNLNSTDRYKIMDHSAGRAGPVHLMTLHHDSEALGQLVESAPNWCLDLAEAVQGICKVLAHAGLMPDQGGGARKMTGWVELPDDLCVGTRAHFAADELLGKCEYNIRNQAESFQRDKQANLLHYYDGAVPGEALVCMVPEPGQAPPSAEAEGIPLNLAKWMLRRRIAAAAMPAAPFNHMATLRRQ